MNIKGILKGTIFAFVVTFLVILILSAVTYFTEADSKIVTVFMYAGVVAGVVLGAFMAARLSEKSALLNSMLVSVIYLAVLIAVSMLINRALEFNGHFITMSVGILASGFLGAVMGK